LTTGSVLLVACKARNASVNSASSQGRERAAEIGLHGLEGRATCRRSGRSALEFFEFGQEIVIAGLFVEIDIFELGQLVIILG